MRSFKTHVILLSLLVSASALADRNRDRHDSGKPVTQSQRHQQPSFKGGYDQSRRHSNQHRQNNPRRYDNNRQHNRHHNQGFNGDYRNNRHFDNRHYQGYDNRHYPNGAYHHGKPKKYYKKWKKRMKKYHKKWRKNHRYYSSYRPYTDDYYRYRPLRGLGHYFHRTGYGYGHWHEGYWCPDYHSDAWFRNYYSHYPHHGGWRFGDGDFGIWFSF
jgi:hypothetical protein